MQAQDIGKRIWKSKLEFKEPGAQAVLEYDSRQRKQLVIAAQKQHGDIGDVQLTNQEDMTNNKRKRDYNDADKVPKFNKKAFDIAQAYDKRQAKELLEEYKISCRPINQEINPLLFVFSGGHRWQQILQRKLGVQLPNNFPLFQGNRLPDEYIPEDFKEAYGIQIIERSGQLSRNNEASLVEDFDQEYAIICEQFIDEFIRQQVDRTFTQKKKKQEQGDGKSEDKLIKVENHILYYDVFKKLPEQIMCIYARLLVYKQQYDATFQLFKDYFKDDMGHNVKLRLLLPALLSYCYMGNIVEIRKILQFLKPKNTLIGQGEYLILLYGVLQGVIHNSAQFVEQHSKQQYKQKVQDYLDNNIQLYSTDMVKQNENSKKQGQKAYQGQSIEDQWSLINYYLDTKQDVVLNLQKLQEDLQMQYTDELLLEIAKNVGRIHPCLVDCIEWYFNKLSDHQEILEEQYHPKSQDQNTQENLEKLLCSSPKYSTDNKPSFIPKTSSEHPQNSQRLKQSINISNETVNAIDNVEQIGQSIQNMEEGEVQKEAEGDGDSQTQIKQKQGIKKQIVKKLIYNSYQNDHENIRIQQILSNDIKSPTQSPQQSSGDIQEEGKEMAEIRQRGLGVVKDRSNYNYQVEDDDIDNAINNNCNWLPSNEAKSGTQPVNNFENIHRQQGNVYSETNSLEMGHKIKDNEIQKKWVCYKTKPKLDGKFSVYDFKLKVQELDYNEWQLFQKDFDECMINKLKQEQIKKIQEFQSFLQSQGPFNIIVDGANIAHYGQNTVGGNFQIGQIYQVYKMLMEKFPDKKILIILSHNRQYCAKSLEEKSFFQQLRDAKRLYFSPKGFDDDVFWMYASIRAFSEGILVTNDQMRNHSFDMLNPFYFSKWRSNHIMNYGFSLQSDVNVADNAHIQPSQGLPNFISNSINNDKAIQETTGEPKSKTLSDSNLRDMQVDKASLKPLQSVENQGQDTFNTNLSAQGGPSNNAEALNVNEESFINTNENLIQESKDKQQSNHSLQRIQSQSQLPQGLRAPIINQSPQKLSTKKSQRKLYQIQRKNSSEHYKEQTTAFLSIQTQMSSNKHEASIIEKQQMIQQLRQEQEHVKDQQLQSQQSEQGKQAKIKQSSQKVQVENLSPKSQKKDTKQLTSQNLQWVPSSSKGYQAYLHEMPNYTRCVQLVSNKVYAIPILSAENWWLLVVRNSKK